MSLARHIAAWYNECTIVRQSKYPVVSGDPQAATASALMIISQPFCGTAVMTVCNGWHWLWGIVGRTAPASDDPSFLVAVHVPTIHYSGIPRHTQIIDTVYFWKFRSKIALWECLLSSNY